jgi:hypothetical protein
MFAVFDPDNYPYAISSDFKEESPHMRPPGDRPGNSDCNRHHPEACFRADNKDCFVEITKVVHLAHCFAICFVSAGAVRSDYSCVVRRSQGPRCTLGVA